MIVYLTLVRRLRPKRRKEEKKDRQESKDAINHFGANFISEFITERAFFPRVKYTYKFRGNRG